MNIEGWSKTADIVCVASCVGNTGARTPYKYDKDATYNSTEWSFNITEIIKRSSSLGKCSVTTYSLDVRSLVAKGITAFDYPEFFTDFKAGGSVVPAFSAVDIHGKKFELKGQKAPVALFFFCDCTWCQDCAHSCSLVQRSGSLISSQKSGSATSVPTVIVFAGDATEAKAFQNISGLLPSETIIIPDPDMQITPNNYKVNVCPRVFVVGPSREQAYTNDHSNDQARVAPSSVIVSNAITAIRSVQSKLLN